MGLLKMLGKKAMPNVGRPKTMHALVTLDNYKNKTTLQIQAFVKGMIIKIEGDYPHYKYEKSVFDFNDRGGMDFKFIMKLRIIGSGN